MLDLIRNILGTPDDRLVDGATAHDLVAKGATLLDVRTPQEFANGSVAKAKNIPIQALQNRLDEIDKEHPVVVFCRSGGRSATAAGVLAASGFRVFDAGGIGRLT